MAIFVDDLRPCGAPWFGGQACHLISDSSLEELRVFAERIGCAQWWLQAPPAASLHHFDLSAKLRRRALELGATPIDRTEFVYAGRRFRAANADLHPAFTENGGLALRRSSSR